MFKANKLISFDFLNILKNILVKLSTIFLMSKKFNGIIILPILKYIIKYFNIYNRFNIT